MALSLIPSSSSNTCQFKYDVFLSFRGKDTRIKFTSHLERALCDKKIETFIDDKLNSGDELSPALLKAIEDSQISIIIFSQDFASSGWCLEELVKILECKQNHQQIVIPVFYEIDPSDVRHQSGSFEVAFAKHQNRTCKDKVQRWKDALKEAANISGFHSLSRDYKNEIQLIEAIVQDVLKRLNDHLPSTDTSSHLVGIDSKIKHIESLLCLGSEGFRSVGLCGIGGIGKTELARAVFNKISCQFDGSYFIENVNEELVRWSGLDRLRQKLRSALLGDGPSLFLGRKKFLIVFDDVFNSRQIESLIVDFGGFNPQSRIIITTRDKQVLRNCGVIYEYKIEELIHREALELFRRHAFGKNQHPTEDYMELSDRVARYTGGLPLALKVLGSHLLGKGKEVWKSVLDKLETISNVEIHQILKISYDGLDDEVKKIFLDIGCFFKGSEFDQVKSFLDACGFHTDDGIVILIDKSLIAISSNKITMHDLIQATAKEIVRQECSEDPGKRSRLWHHEDICRVLTKNTGTKRTEAISLDMSSSEVRDIKINPHAFKKAKKLRLLNFHVKNVWENSGNKVHIPDDLDESNLTELKYFHWYKCPLKSFQRKFHFEKLVVLEMRHSNIEELWSDDSVQTLYYLKKIDLSGSQHLISCPDLSLVPNLESLMLKGCTSLESIPDCTCLESLKQLIVEECSKLKRLPQLPPNLEDIGLDDCTSLVEIQSSFTHLHKVRRLILKNLYSLTSIQDLRGLKSLTTLVISNCSKLKMLPDLRGLKSLTGLAIFHCSKLKMSLELPNNIEWLDLEDVPIEESPPSWEDLDRLRGMFLKECPMLKSLPSSVRKWKSLGDFRMTNCSKIDKLPDDIGALESLYSFTAEGTAIGEVPSSISCLKSLTYLSISRCEGVDGAGLLLPPNLSHLILSDCGIATLPDGLWYLTSLQALYLGRNNFESIPGSIINLSKLYYLDISYCKMLRELPQLPAGTSIEAENCTSLERLSNFEFQNDIFEEPSIQNANFVNCYKLDPDALNDVVYDTRRKIKGQADLVKKDTLWKIYEQQNAGPKPAFLPASIIYPGSKIPKWFENQSGESFIEVELPSDCLNSNFLCYALCVVVAPNPDRQCNHPDFEGHRFSQVTFDCNVKSKDGNESYLFGHHQYTKKPCIFLRMPYCGPDYLKSNHVITCFAYYFFHEFCDNEFSFKFNAKNFNWVGDSVHDDDKDKEHFKVEMCGVHLMSHLHLEVSDEEDESHLEELDE